MPFSIDQKFLWNPEKSEIIKEFCKLHKLANTSETSAIMNSAINLLLFAENHREIVNELMETYELLRKVGKVGSELKNILKSAEGREYTIVFHKHIESQKNLCEEITNQLAKSFGEFKQFSNYFSLVELAEDGRNLRSFRSDLENLIPDLAILASNNLISAILPILEKKNLTEPFLNLRKTVIEKSDLKNKSKSVSTLQNRNSEITQKIIKGELTATFQITEYKADFESYDLKIHTNLMPEILFPIKELYESLAPQKTNL